MKPYPNEHASRQTDPDKYKRFARQKDKGGDGIDFIFGITEDGKTELQSIRFDKNKYTPEQAKKWLKDHGMKENLEEAKSEEKHIKVTTKIDKDGLIESLKRKLTSIQRRAEGAVLDKADELMNKLDDDLDEDELEELRDEINELSARLKFNKQENFDVKVVRPPQTVKVIYTPPDAEQIIKGVSDAVERAIARRMGKII